MKRVLPLLAAATVAFSVLPAFADNQAPTAEEILAQAPAGGVAQVGAPQAAERAALRLSDAQLEQLRALKDKYFADNTMKKAQLKILQHELRGALTKETIDRSAVLAVQSKINALRADLSNSRISMMLDASQVFTPEQRKAMHSRMLRHGGMGGGRGGCGGKRGGKGHHFKGGHGGRFGGPRFGQAAPQAPDAGSKPASVNFDGQTPAVES